jgi:hypothetical protein
MPRPKLEGSGLEAGSHDVPPTSQAIANTTSRLRRRSLQNWGTSGISFSHMSVHVRCQSWLTVAKLSQKLIYDAHDPYHPIISSSPETIAISSSLSSSSPFKCCLGLQESAISCQLPIYSHQIQVLWQTLLVRSIKVSLHEVYATYSAAAPRSEHSRATQTSAVMPRRFGDLDFQWEPSRDCSPVVCS